MRLELLKTEHRVIPTYTPRHPEPLYFRGENFNPIIIDARTKPHQLIEQCEELCLLYAPTYHEDIEHANPFRRQAVQQLIHAAFLPRHTVDPTIRALQKKYFNVMRTSKDQVYVDALLGIAREACLGVTALKDGYTVYPTPSKWDIYKGIDFLLVKGSTCLPVDAKNNEEIIQEHAEDALPVWIVNVDHRKIKPGLHQQEIYGIPFEYYAPHLTTRIVRQLDEGIDRIGIPLQ